MKIKNKTFRSIVCLGGLTLMSTAFAASDFKNDDQKFSYIVGHQIASSLRNDDLNVDTKTLVKALEEGLSGKESTLSAQDSQTFVSQYMTAKQKAKGEKNLKLGQDFLANNKKEKDIVTLPSGLQYKVIETGKGTKPKATDTVTVDYEGTLVDGKVFDSSYKRGEPVSFPVSGVIKGWTEALQLMPEGSTWELYIPANLAYGEQSPSPLIGPNSTLKFKVHLISVAQPKETKTAAVDTSAKKPAKK